MNKKLVFMVVAMVMSVGAFAQKQIVWFDAGLRLQGGGSGLLNKTIVDDPNANYELALTNSYGIGGRLGINKSYSGLSLEVMFNNSEQTFEVPDVAGSTTANVTTSWKSIDFYPLFRNAKNLGYFEIGPKISFLRGVTDAFGKDAKDNYKSTNIGAALGFGAYVLGTDGAFSATLGLRFEYGITDYVSDDAPEGYTPIGVAITNIAGEPLPREATRPFFAGLVFEANWGIGYYGVAQCGGRSKFMMF